jgi:hypothetical protein
LVLKLFHVTYAQSVLKNEIKICPKCKIEFECKVSDVANCQCHVEINEATKVFLAKTSFDCLCVSCLQNFNQLATISQNQLFPSNEEMLIEGLHFYKENNYWVFTQLYHMLRGYCCKNGCRHCVYGFEKSI